MIAYVVSGIGFLGAGVIMKEGMNVRGLNTAATLWGSAAVGSCAGADMVAQAVALTVFVLAGNTLLRPAGECHQSYPARRAGVGSHLSLQARGHIAWHCRPCATRWSSGWKVAKYPVADVEVVELGDDLLEIVATLVSTAIDPVELDAVAVDLQRQPGVRHATWEVSTKE